MTATETPREADMSQAWIDDCEEAALQACIAAGVCVVCGGDHPMRWGALPCASAPPDAVDILRRLGQPIPSRPDPETEQARMLEVADPTWLRIKGLAQLREAVAS